MSTAQTVAAFASLETVERLTTRARIDGRAQETYGKDPDHLGALGAALTRGVQRQAPFRVQPLNFS